MENLIVSPARPYIEVFGEHPFCVAGITTRAGGVSEGYLSAMNVGTHCGDSPEALEENYRRLSAWMEIPYENMVSTNQKHTDVVRRVEMEDAGVGITRPRFSEGVDAIITNAPHLPLIAYFADCVPVLFCDPIQKAVGVCHSGWRGTAQKIAEKTVLAMKQEFGSAPQDIRAVIGPHIGKCCFEVDAPVAEEFLKAFPKEGGFYTQKGEKYHIDLTAAVAHALSSAGVEHIEKMDICTACNSETFFSHRKTGGKRGCFGAVISIK